MRPVTKEFFASCDWLRANTHFASQIILLLGTLYFKVAWYTLLPNLLCSWTQSTPWHILLFNTHCSLEYFSPQHTLLQGTLCFQEHFAFCVPESKVCWGEHFTEEQNVPVSKMFQGAKCSWKQNVLWSKVFQEAKCSREQNVLRSKMFWGAKYDSAKCAKEQSVLWSKVCLSLYRGRIFRGLVVFEKRNKFSFRNNFAPLWQLLPTDNYHRFLITTSRETIICGFPCTDFTTENYVIHTPQLS